MKDTPSTRIIDFVLAKAVAEPIAQRCTLYRDLSTLVADDDASRRLVGLAGELEALERRCQQLMLDFRRSHT